MGLDLSGNGSSETRLDRDPAHSAHGFGQQVASLVLWFGLDDWVIDQIDREATRTLMPSPPRRNNPTTSHVPSDIGERFRIHGE